jgi:general secretion pathway protein K
MRIQRPTRDNGIALIIVMIVIIVLAVLAGGFAYSMKVETRLARNSSFDSDMENLGRSAVERARYILAMHLRIPGEGAYSSLNQFWASGIPSTNELLMDMSLENDELPRGHTIIQITDMERKFNLSAIRDERYSPILQKALEMMNADPIQVDDIVESYLDWVDPDDNKRLKGAESDFYTTLNPAAPYVAKNGIMDDISEFLLVRGMTPEIFFGAGRAGSMPGFGAAPRSAPVGTLGTAAATAGASVGIVDLFTTISAAGMAVNVNTASSEVLQLLPGMDATLAQSIIDTRAGPDHQDATEDDIPYLQRGEIINAPGMTPELMQAMSPFLVTQSSIFLIRVEASLGDYVRRYEALVQRRNAMDVTMLYFRAL